MINKKYSCPICGFLDSFEEPCCEYYGDGKYSSNYEICSSCGFQCGYDDTSWVGPTHKIWREEWIKNGKFWSKNNKPLFWNMEKQLKNLEKLTEEEKFEYPYEKVFSHPRSSEEEQREYVRKQLKKD